jgi:hypothetical protein
MQRDILFLFLLNQSRLLFFESSFKKEKVEDG